MRTHATHPSIRDYNKNKYTMTTFNKRKSRENKACSLIRTYGMNGLNKKILGFSSFSGYEIFSFELPTPGDIENRLK